MVLRGAPDVQSERVSSSGPRGIWTTDGVAAVEETVIARINGNERSRPMPRLGALIAGTGAAT
jgi:hypothetical protein